MVRRVLVNTTAVFLVLASSVAAGDDWPQFRGPGGQGHADAAELPLSWSESDNSESDNGESKNIIWKTPLPGRGWSSPVIGDDRIWMTMAVATPASPEHFAEKSAERSDAASLSLASEVALHAICVASSTGELLHNVHLLTVENPGLIHSMNSYASPTPVIEGDRLYCHFGAYGTVCLNTKTAEILWTNRELIVDHQNGPGSSPVLWRDLLFLTCDGQDEQYVAAIDKRDGHVVWTRNRSGEMSDQDPLKKTYTTPLVIDDPQQAQLISPGANWVYSYDPETGRELWRASYGQLGFSTVPRPVVGHGMVYVCTSFMQSRLLAVRYDGQGDVTDTHVAWFSDKQIPQMPSTLLVDDRLYFVNDKGRFSCLDALSGELLWRSRLGGVHVASPLYSEGRIYLFSEDGKTTVLRPGPREELLATNQLDGRFMATPAVAGGALYLRSESHLYRVEEDDE